MLAPSGGTSAWITAVRGLGQKVVTVVGDAEYRRLSYAGRILCRA
ncbi:unnamed protein product [Callosobruchus maculatus]|uniref:Uncharacterized protein n=1 Tax=Callosobruchus maculatus TaxID=64391 RepID=A0A653C3I4_CALMS|nr:unnamed protein product [Callosobruchus maculatus]